MPRYDFGATPIPWPFRRSEAERPRVGRAPLILPSLAWSCGARGRYHRGAGSGVRTGRGGLTKGPRIISGRWRRRRLRFPGARGVRPTPDRVKETVFNWLGPRVSGAACLDLFAGSGSLGFEAASRGAASVTMVEIDSTLVSYLRKERESLGASGVDVVRADALQWLGRAAGPFDIVFLDPPFSTALLERACRGLSTSGCLAPCALLYLECERTRRALPLPEGYEVRRAGRAGEVRYHLAGRRGACPSGR